MSIAEKLSTAYAPQLTVARRSLRRTLASMGGPEAWKAILERLPKARFLLGQGKCGFWISFEALCSEHVRIRLLEGAYDHVPGMPESAKPASVSDVSIERWRQTCEELADREQSCVGALACILRDASQDQGLPCAIGLPGVLALVRSVAKSWICSHSGRRIPKERRLFLSRWPSVNFMVFQTV